MLLRSRVKTAHAAAQWTLGPMLTWRDTTAAQLASVESRMALTVADTVLDPACWAGHESAPQLQEQDAGCESEGCASRPEP